METARGFFTVSSLSLLTRLTRPLLSPQNRLVHTQSPNTHLFSSKLFLKSPSVTSSNYNSQLASPLLLSRFNSSLRKNSQTPEINRVTPTPITSKSKPNAKLSQPITRKNFLASSKGPLHSAWLNMKWILLRQNRPFNADEISAVASWVVMGNFLWIFIGTTTFAGLIIYLSELFIDGSINKSILKKLITYDNKFNLDIDGDDFKMSFKDGKISFDNVVLKSKPKNNKNDHNDTDKKIGATEYKLTIDTINMTLSLGKWSEGRGLIKDVEIIGLVGDVDFKKNNEFFVDDSLSDDYEFEKLKISDLKVDFKSDNFKEPIELKVFSYRINMPISVKWRAKKMKTHGRRLLD
ncbi:unnamed protein product [Ambrosiozyma monospora]|uniref:Unnamed protein product n=1 Tax=Ambrosiozyma monospora TaxID=43982 RepID=A0ACB5TIT8_AMBMO|nr:unnamed protein product [Ambrosiozyma monospora]